MAEADTTYSGVTQYPGLPAPGEYIDYTLPINIVPVRYEIGFDTDSWPLRWILYGKLDNKEWQDLDTRNYVDGEKGYNKIDPAFRANVYANTLSYDITEKYTVDSLRLFVSVSSGISIKIREFRIFDQFGRFMPFLVPFCTNTSSMYHSGSLNFSRLDHFSIDAPLQSDFYAVGHDFIEIDKGMISGPTR